jgi:hypothetical protein
MFAIRIYLSTLTLMLLTSLLRREASPSLKPQ